MGRDIVGVSQTDAGRPLAAAAAAWLVIHGAARVSRVTTDILGMVVWHDPLVGLMLAGQQFRPRPGMTIRRWRGN